MLLCGKPFSAIGCCFLCIFGWAPGVSFARLTVLNHYANRRTKKEIKAINNPDWISQVLIKPKNNQYRLPPVRGQKTRQLRPLEYDDVAVGGGGHKFRRKNQF